MRIGVHVLPKFPKDTTDRNRTSPFAFTGNKFEFRMLGASASISDANVALNTAVAEELRQFADILEASDDFEDALHNLILDVIKNHKRIIFNGNGYDESWIKEAAERGLLNLTSTTDAVPYYVSEKNIRLFTSNKVFSEAEIHARYEIMLESYSKIVSIEALTMLDIARKDILPAASIFSGELSATALSKKALTPTANCNYEEELVEKISSLISEVYSLTGELENALSGAKALKGAEKVAKYYKDSVLSVMMRLRTTADELETITAKRHWPYPSYSELLFGVD